MEPREPKPPTLDEVKALIDRLPREDRSRLQSWILARFDVRGYPTRGYQEPPPEEKDDA